MLAVQCRNVGLAIKLIDSGADRTLKNLVRCRMFSCLLLLLPLIARWRCPQDGVTVETVAQIAGDTRILRHLAAAPAPSPPGEPGDSKAASEHPSRDVAVLVKGGWKDNVSPQELEKVQIEARTTALLWVG